jgi:UDP-glucose 4-epimerase
MKILVTGGAGFIGTYLIPSLVERGVEVVVLDLSAAPAALAPVMDRITYVRADLGQSDDIYRAMLKYRPDQVVHLVSLLAGPCEANPPQAFRVNFNSTLTLLEAGAIIGLKRLVMTSSISVFGRGCQEPVQDDALKEPSNIYGQTKLACEHLLRFYAQHKGVDGRALRFTWVFGPGRSTGITAAYSSLLLDAAARDQEIDVPNPEETGDWLYVKDAVKALLLLLDAPEAPQRIYNIAGGVHSIRDVLAIVQKLKPKARIVMQPGGRLLSPYPAAYDDGPARRDLGWRPDYTIETAVAEHLRIVGGQNR